MFYLLRRTVCVTGAGAGVDNAWEQEKPEARKMLENAAESHTSGARFVRQPCRLSEHRFLPQRKPNISGQFQEMVSPLVISRRLGLIVGLACYVPTIHSTSLRLHRSLGP